MMNAHVVAWCCWKAAQYEMDAIVETLLHTSHGFWFRHARASWMHRAHREAAT